jgi:hypothetical protein
MVVSKDLHSDFQEFMLSKEVPLPFDFEPIILTSGSWPFKFINSEFSLPQEVCVCNVFINFEHEIMPFHVLVFQLEMPVNSFVEFYTVQHKGRKLIWLQNRSKGELHCNCSSEPHILQVSMFQMSILLMFNTAMQHSFHEILDLTKLTPDLCSFVSKA